MQWKVGVFKNKHTEILDNPAIFVMCIGVKLSDLNTLTKEKRNIVQIYT